MSKIILLSLVFAFLTSCNSGGSGGNSPEPGRKLFQGDLDKKASEIYGPDNEWYFYDCDKNQRRMVLEISAAVEANRANILALQKQLLSQNTEAQIVKMNGYEFVDQKPKEYPDQWEEDRYSWSSLYFIYERIKNDPLNITWMYLNADARSLILEDDDRISAASHPGFRRGEKERILRVHEILKSCFNSESCTSISLDATDEQWLREGIYHSYILDRMSSSDSLESKRKRIGFLFRDIGYGARRHGFNLNNSIKVENGTLVVPLNLEVLGNDAHLFTERLEKTWGTLGLSLKVVNSTEGFTVKISDTPGERAYVSSGERLMQLFSPTKLATVDHEFGHILGLMDTYYTSFDQKTCEYVDEYNRGDIMSMRGKVLPAHIEQIKKAYGL